MKVKKNKLAVFMILLLVTGSCFAARIYQTKSVYIFNFCQYVSWPDSKFSKPTAPIVIAVAGSSMDFKVLRTLAQDRDLNGRSFKVINITKANNLKSVHVLYLPRDSYYALPEFYENAKKNAVLVVTEVPDDDTEKRGIINFIQQNQQVKFDISLPKAQEFHLQISSELLAVSRIVYVDGKQHDL